MLPLPHLIEVRTRFIVGILGHQEPAVRRHEEMRVIERPDRALHIAAIKGGNKIQCRLAGPAQDFRSLGGLTRFPRSIGTP